MKIDTTNLISMTEANQNFSNVIKKVNEHGKVIILKNNKPQYVVSKFEDDDFVVTEDEKLEIIAKRILNEHKKAFEVLANDKIWRK